MTGDSVARISSGDVLSLSLGGVGPILVELSVVEQRYHGVMEVLADAPVAEVAERYGVSRKQVYVWLARYREGGLGGFADRSHRPRSHPWRLDAEVEARLVQMRIWCRGGAGAGP